MPWYKSKNHDPENLVCLCANCHQRSDVENWGKKTLLQYKREPWVNRRFTSSHPETETSTIEIVINAHLADFDDHKEEMLRYALAGLLRISPKNIRIGSVEEGSVILKIQLPNESAKHLLRLYESKSPDLSSWLASFEIERISSAVADHSQLFSSLSEYLVAGSVALPIGSRVELTEEPHELTQALQAVRPAARKMLHAYSIPAEDAEEIVQRCMLDVLLVGRKVHDPQASFLGRLRNRCIEFVRRRDPLFAEKFDSTVIDLLSTTDQEGKRGDLNASDLKQAVDRLPRRCQEILRLRYNLGYLPSETAAKMGLDRSSLQAITNRCLRRLSRELLIVSHEKR